MELRQGFNWLHKILGSSVILLVLAVLTVIGVAGFFGRLMIKELESLKQEQQMMVANIRVLNEQSIVSQIISEKVGDKLPADIKAQAAFTLIEEAKRLRLPLPLMMAIIEQESRWDPRAFNKASGASGWCQVMPGTAMPLFRAKGVQFTMERLIDPILNLTLGAQVLRDKQDAAVAMGKSPEDDWAWALYWYSGKGESYAREVVTRSVEYKKRLEAPLEKK